MPALQGISYFRKALLAASPTKRLQLSFVCEEKGSIAT